MTHLSDIPDIYSLESIDQLKAIADELPQRIIHVLARGSMTVTQLGAVFDQPPANLRYHVRELERLGLVVLVEKREKSGILEKYYRTRARTLSIPATLFRDNPPDEMTAAISTFLQDVSHGFLESFTLSADDATVADDTTLTRRHLWTTDGELDALRREIADLVERYERRRGVTGEHEWTFVQMLYNPHTENRHGARQPAVTIEHQDDRVEDFTTSGPAARVNVQRDTQLRTWTVGSTSYGRQDLERVAGAGKRLDIVSIGRVTFRDDVPADLVDRAVFRFRHRGSLSASHAVREVLNRKGGHADIES